jgi:hypothetical protein
VLHELFPNLESLDLTLFQAHGFQSEKQCYKESYHAVWKDLIVDKGRAHVIRLATIAKFNAESVPKGRVFDLHKTLLEVDTRNTWEAVFDIASVRGGSFRMPFCGKVYKNRIERPILPEAIMDFRCRSERLSCQVLHDKTDKHLSDIDWIKRGRVRLLALPGESYPSLTQWRPVKLGALMKSSKSKAPVSSSMGSWQDRKDAKDKKIKERWEEEQRMRRRLWNGSPSEFRDLLNKQMEDETGDESHWVTIKAKAGCERWSWSHRRLKGLVELEKPSGEVFIRGSKENQLFLLEMVKHFTREYTGALPKMKAPVKTRQSNRWAAPRYRVQKWERGRKYGDRGYRRR